MQNDISFQIFFCALRVVLSFFLLRSWLTSDLEPKMKHSRGGEKKKWITSAVITAAARVEVN